MRFIKRVKASKKRFLGTPNNKLMRGYALKLWQPSSSSQQTIWNKLLHARFAIRISLARSSEILRRS